MPTAIPPTFWRNGPRLGNNLLYSQDFTNAVWTKLGGSGGSPPVLTADYATAPDGTLTANRAQFSKGAGGYSTLRQLVNASQQKKTFSVWLKSNTEAVQGPVLLCIYDIANSTTGVAVQATVTGEWQLFQVTLTNLYLNSTTLGCDIFLYTSSPTTADILIWGANCVDGLVAGAYTPTTEFAAEADSPAYVPLEVPSSPTIFAMSGGTPGLLEGNELALSEDSPCFGWNIDAPKGGRWKVGDLLVERTPYNPQLRICSTEGSPGTWKTLINSMGLPREILDFNSMDDFEGWTYSTLSDLSTTPVGQPLTSAQVSIANSRLNQVAGAWLLLQSPLSQTFLDGVYQINCKPGQPSGHILRGGTSTQGLLINQATNGDDSWNIRIWTHAGGSWAFSGLEANTPVLDPNTFYTYTYVLNGNVVQMYIGSTLIFQFTQGYLNTGGNRYGFRQNGASQQFACWIRLIPLAGINWSET